MAAPLVQNIPNQRLTGSQSFLMATTQAPFTNAAITVDRTVNGGLNTLTLTDTLTVGIDYSPDGGTAWVAVAAFTLPGGTFVTKGVTQTQDFLAIGAPGGDPFPVGTAFRINTLASTPVRITATVTYS
jgi:hypothetical protein